VLFCVVAVCLLAGAFFGCLLFLLYESRYTPQKEEEENEYDEEIPRAVEHSSSNKLKQNVPVRRPMYFSQYSI
jgi:hypothetical protein